MKVTAQTILDLARKELGVTESPPGSNRVKYNTLYYGREVAGDDLHWCAVFVWWLFGQAGASELYFGGGKTAYCPTLLHHHRHQKVSGDYRPGDIIFFNFNGGTLARHVGICESFDGTYITTIDGNTGTADEANGGAVLRRTRHKKYIVGAYRPAYEEMVRVQTLQRQDEQFAAIKKADLSQGKLKDIQDAIHAFGFTKVNLLEG